MDTITSTQGSTQGSTQDSTQDSTQEERQRLIFEFRGDGLEYFKIWIVNVLLSIITMGIYSAWAKVRSARYFYSNLYLDNANFRYLAEPLAILKGRIIAIAVFLLYSFLAKANPVAGGILLAILLFVLPYFFNQAVAFNHRMSAYNNIQFRFKGDYAQAFLVLYVWPILGVLSLGIMYPYAMLQLNRYLVNNSSYGTTAFTFNASYKDYGMIFLIMFAVGLVGGAIVWAITSIFGTSTLFASPLLMTAVYLGLIVYFMVQTTNLFYKSLALAEHGFSAELDMVDLAKVMLTNVLLIALTAGLYLPAAKVRMARYMASNIYMYAGGPLDGFIAAEQENVSALGEELGQVFDFGM